MIPWGKEIVKPMHNQPVNKSAKLSSSEKKKAAACPSREQPTSCHNIA
jgi:hypothetical protein